MLADTDWDRSADPAAMIARLFPLRSEGSRVEVGRRERLYYCALARRHWHDLSQAGCAILQTAERLADGTLLGPFPYLDAFRLAEQLADCCGDEAEYREICSALARIGFPAEDGSFSLEDWQAKHYPLLVTVIENGPGTRFPELRHDADRIRDAFPLPNGKLPEFDPRWRTSAAVDLAAAMYAAQVFEHMPLLGDMLADAGCDSRAVLEHCADPYQPHARGCWVLDSVLGRSA
jgi:hypothetical protein